MAKKPVQDYSWRISRIRGTPAADVGTVQAPDAETAIQVAIEKYKITDPEKQKRLVAQRLR
jgi:1,2-phenylacetyl-CoA epoxidase PaaB subunit